MSAETLFKFALSKSADINHSSSYCFWCGTAYSSAEELATECPGVDEEDH